MKLSKTIGVFALYFTVAYSPLNAQNVNIPDANFKAYLVANSNINTNNDTEIQVSEANAFNGKIDCYNLNITDLTGIETFINLTELECYSNQLSGLDLSQNINLTHLDCDNNQLTNINLVQNTNLIELKCSYNQLTNLDISQNTNLSKFKCDHNQLANLDLHQNTALRRLDCDHNQLTTLDLSQNADLTNLNCYNNQLSSLDMSQNTDLVILNCYNNQLLDLDVKNGNNTNFMLFNATNNPNLTCIQVDDSTFSANNWADIDAGAYFSNNCTLINSFQTVSIISGATISPNPTSNLVNINLGTVYPKAAIQVMNLVGQVLFEKKFNNVSETEIQLEGPKGVYLIKIQTKSTQQTFRIIKN
ncbi:T9SS type A sorting domain-containing protein [Aureispira sp. CCB-QB1]|uniref:T9SS type A sorting domain-containing protein n=1 Tax=Aureispira sp. CCB-QB1 TaxID=1313421 RepID=UPI0006974ACA|nr:T9SS type A sorting domain-containing protein [Aureispira sp. CCB-QB1]